MPGDTPDVKIQYHDPECQQPYRRIRPGYLYTWSGDEHVRTVRQWFVGDDGLTSIERRAKWLEAKLADAEKREEAAFRAGYCCDRNVLDRARLRKAWLAYKDSRNEKEGPSQ